MFDKLFSFLGFNSGNNLVGLAQLGDLDTQQKAVKAPVQSKKDMKLSDLMRGM